MRAWRLEENAYRYYEIITSHQGSPDLDKCPKCSLDRGSSGLFPGFYDKICFYWDVVYLEISE